MVELRAAALAALQLLSMFQNTIRLARSTPVTLERHAQGWTYWPTGTSGSVSHKYWWSPSSAARLGASSAARIYAVRSSSVLGSHGQPNHLSPSHAELIVKLVNGEDIRVPPTVVWNMFQPPWLGGSFFARRATMVPQSLTATSTLTPILRRLSAVTSPSAEMLGISPVVIRTIFSPL